MTVSHNGHTYTVRLLSGQEALACIRDAQKAEETLFEQDDNPELISSLAEYGALASYCLCENGKRIFADVSEALHTLSIEALCDTYDCYETLSRQKKDLPDRDIAQKGWEENASFPFGA